MQTFGWYVLSIILLTVAIVYVTIFNPYVITKSTRVLPIPEAQAEFETVFKLESQRIEDYRSGNNTLAIIHIQKTGGKEFAMYFQNIKTKGKSVCEVRNITSRPNRIRSGKCYINLPKSREMWLVSETTYGWPCGVHPFLIELKSCLPLYLENRFGKRHRSLQFTTIIRHPIIRYLSEFQHCNTYAPWRFRTIKCNGTKYFQNETSCMRKIRSKVTFEDYISPCPESRSVNRQTMMLADIDKTGCLDPAAMSSEKRDSILLATAKQNLKEMMFFGVTEYMKESILLLEHRFDVQFDSPLSQPLIKDLNGADLLHKVWSNSTLYKEISSINYLDVQLYEYGLKLFKQRLQQIHINIDLRKIDREIYSLNFNSTAENENS